MRRWPLGCCSAAPHLALPCPALPRQAHSEDLAAEDCLGVLEKCHQQNQISTTDYIKQVRGAGRRSRCSSPARLRRAVAPLAACRGRPAADQAAGGGSPGSSHCRRRGAPSQPAAAPRRRPQVRAVATRQFFARARRLKVAVQQQQLPSILAMSQMPVGPQQLQATYNYPGAPRPTGSAPMHNNPLAAR